MNKKYLVFGLMGLFAVALVSAALIPYFAKVKTNVDVIAPITLDDSLFDISSETLNDGNNHYLLVKGWNSFSEEVLTDIVITITKEDESGNPVIVTDIEGIHIAVDTGGDMHYCYDPAGDMANVNNCDVDYVQYLTNNPDLFSWGGTDDDYIDSGFVSPVNGNGWIPGSTFVVDGVLKFPIGVDSGIIASLIAIRADFGLEPGNYTIEVEFKPRV